MRGERIGSLKQAMLMLASDAAVGSARYARFQNREEVGIITFSTEPAPTSYVPYGLHAAAKRVDPSRHRAISSGRCQPVECTAMYSSIAAGASRIGRERAACE